MQEIVQESLNPNKAMGLDNISPRDLKLCESSVVQGLFEIFMKSRADCQFPISWKKSQVAAVFKKGNRLDVNNYIPISLLSIPSKILERVVCRSFDNHSLLGPRLFITYVNDLPESIRSGEVYMYADDTTIHTIGNTTDEVAIALQVILDQLQTWCQKNRLIIHEGKCDVVLLDTKPFIGPLKPLIWGDKTIEYRSFSVCLGIAIDERLSWANHVKSVSTSYSSKVKMLRRISFLSKAILETIYYKTVIPSVLYAMVVWGSCSDHLMKDLDLI